MIYLALVLIAIIGFSLSLEINTILRENGFKINYLDGGMTNSINFYSILKDEKSRGKKVKYLILFVALIITIISFIVTSIISIQGE